jgi:hypothetical protein
MKKYYLFISYLSPPLLLLLASSVMPKKAYVYIYIYIHIYIYDTYIYVYIYIYIYIYVYIYMLCSFSDWLLCSSQYFHQISIFMLGSFSPLLNTCPCKRVNTFTTLLQTHKAFL